jgi:hypothetical protein
MTRKLEEVVADVRTLAEEDQDRAADVLAVFMQQLQEDVLVT